MDRANRTILVFGATGQQGGAAMRHLLARGWRVRALSRSLHTPVVQTLQQAGVEVVQGDLGDPVSLEVAMQGVYGVFSVQPHSDDEARQGKSVADAAKRSGVQHFVYMSIGSAEELFRLHVNVGKWEIEQHILALGLPATVLRPAGFMDSLVSPLYGVSGDTLAIPIKPDVPYQLVAVEDLGIFAALVFDSPAEYQGRTIELVGDAPTPLQIAAIISQASGHSISYVQVPIETIRQQNAELARACEFMNARGFKADIPALRKMHPGLLDFATWMEQIGKTKFAANSR